MDSICVWTCKGLAAEAADHRVGCSTLGPVTFIRRGHATPAPATASPDTAPALPPPRLMPGINHRQPRLGRVTCPVPCPVLLSA